jgi:hypothetical protein
MDRRLALAVFRAVVAVIVLVAIGLPDQGHRRQRAVPAAPLLRLLHDPQQPVRAFLWLWLAVRWRRERTRLDDLLRGAATLYLVGSRSSVVVLLLGGAELSLYDRIVDFVVHKLFPGPLWSWTGSSTRPKPTSECRRRPGADLPHSSTSSSPSSGR